MVPRLHRALVQGASRAWLFDPIDVAETTFFGVA